MKPLSFSQSASLELTEAVRWYEQRRTGWGARLFDAVSHAVDLIERHPDIGSPRTGHQNVRQLTVRGFPLHVVYRARADDVYVVAVAHAKRRPDYWTQR